MRDDIVTTHALVRYFERIKGVLRPRRFPESPGGDHDFAHFLARCGADVRAALDRIATPEQRDLIRRHPGMCGLRGDDFKRVICDGAVVTVLGKSAPSEWERRLRRAQRRHARELQRVSMGGCGAG